MLPELHRTFEQTVDFHNSMIREKIKYIGGELPFLENQLSSLKKEITNLLEKENSLAKTLNKTDTVKELENIIAALNTHYEEKGSLEEKKTLWEKSNSELGKIEEKLSKINNEINASDQKLQGNIAKFNRYFSNTSEKLYGEKFVLSTDKHEDSYELNIDTLTGNPGTGKKKGQIAAFDLAYVQFADANNIPCLHFILHDQIENVHDNQISNLLTEVVDKTNCQYILPVLRDKLPNSLDVEPYIILRLSQQDKLFKVP